MLLDKPDGTTRLQLDGSLNNPRMVNMGHTIVPNDSKI